MRFVGYRTLKTGIGTAIAMIIAEKLGLEYALSAGIITILSVQNTKRQSFNLAISRIISCIVALIVASVIFRFFGFKPMTFGLFLIVFIPIAVKFNVEEGIVVSSVLVSHLLVEKNVSIFWIHNELFLMFIGVGVALILNLYMPNIEKQIDKDKIFIQDKIREILVQMSEALKEQSISIKDETLIKQLEERLYLTRNKAYKSFNNYLFLDVSYYVQYIEMRIKQFENIKRMREHFYRFFMTYDQNIMISNFTLKVANNINDGNKAEELLEELQLLRDEFKKMSLPLTREEFENRAMLFQFLNDLEEFLKIKNEFKKNWMSKD